MTIFENESNKAFVEADQVFDFSPIKGSTISGPITNTQTQVAVSLAFDEFELSLPLIGALEISLPGISTQSEVKEGNKFHLNIDGSGAFINGKEIKIDKKDLGNGKKVISLKYDNQDLKKEEDSQL